MAEARDDARGLQQTATDLASGLEAPDAGDGRIIESTAAATGTLTVQVSDIAGNAAQVRDRVNEEVDMLGRLAGTAGQLAATGQEVHAAADEARSTAESTAASLRESGDDVHQAVSGLQEMTTQVDDMTSGLGRFQEALERIQKASSSIAAIAKQTNLLAVNASIEAARSGSAGQGFGVVAEQIGTLAEETGEATRNIQRTVEGLATSARSLMDKGRDGAERAERVRADSRTMGDVLATLEGAMDSVASQSGRIRDAATEMGETCSQVDSGMDQLRQQVEHSAQDLGSASEHLDELLGKGEALLNLCNSTDADTPDRPMIEQAQYGAAQAGAALEKAIAEGRLSEADVFDRDHVPVPGTNPQQYTTRYVDVTDQLFPAFQEEILEAHEKILSCCSTDNHGYIGTHNLHTSKPQRPDDPDWNRANSRHRQMYTDRVGLGAARNTRPFLLQAYRRNMGGKFVLTKDASAPIYVHGRHWGACRVIYVP